MRTDIHSPSQIIPEDYQYVAVWTMNIQGLGDAKFILREREIVRKHMALTGGTYAHVETSGSCQVCGNVLAIYLSLHYHAKSNTYVRVGFDCEAKLGMSSEDHNIFRRSVQNAREAQAGKRKAIAILGDNGLSEAWDISQEPYPQHSEECRNTGTNCVLCGGMCHNCNHDCACGWLVRSRAYEQFPERTIRDIVGKLVKYGSVSEKQLSFVRSLLQQIAQRPIVEAQRKAEAEAAGPVPTGRVRLHGEVLSVKTVETNAAFYGDSGIRTKVLIKLDNGSKVYGNRFEDVEKGQQVDFVATVTVSDKDPKFGFFSRPNLPGPSPEEKKAARELKKFLSTVAWG